MCWSCGDHKDNNMIPQPMTCVDYGLTKKTQVNQEVNLLGLGRNRSIFVGVGWDRNENPLLCHTLLKTCQPASWCHHWHYRPVALTSILMKCFEKLVLQHIKDTSVCTQNQQIRRGCHLHCPHSILHTPWISAYQQHLHQKAVCWFQLSIQHNLPCETDGNLGLSTTLCDWILDFLTNRPQTDWQSHLLHSSAQHWKPPRAVCSAPSCSRCIPTTAVPDMERTLFWTLRNNTTFISWISNNSENSYREESCREVHSKQPAVQRQWNQGADRWF